MTDIIVGSKWIFQGNKHEVDEVIAISPKGEIVIYGTVEPGKSVKSTWVYNNDKETFLKNYYPYVEPEKYYIVYSMNYGRIEVHYSGFECPTSVPPLHYVKEVVLD